MFVFSLLSYWYQMIQGFIKYLLRYLNLKYHTNFSVEFQSCNALAWSVMPELVYKHVTKKKGDFLIKKIHWYFRLQNVKYFNNYSILWHQYYITMFLSMRIMLYLTRLFNCHWVEGVAAFFGDTSGFIYKILCSYF